MQAGAKPDLCIQYMLCLGSHMHCTRALFALLICLSAEFEYNQPIKMKLYMLMSLIQSGSLTKNMLFDTEMA